MAKEKTKKINKKNKLSKKQKTIIGTLACVLILIASFSIATSKEGQTKTQIKSTLDKLVEKSNLETVTFTYNVIAKECKNSKKCDKTSNDIDDFKYVVSCKGTVTAGIDFKKIKIEKDTKKKKYIVKVPEATVTDDNVNVISIRFINGDELEANVSSKARKLCAETIKEKSSKDKELLPKAKEQAVITLQSFYGQWIKAIEEDYKIEVK